MKKHFITASILSLALVSIATAQSEIVRAESGDHYTQSQLKRLAHEAHTPEQCRALANGYSAQQKDYLQQAAEEKREWERRSQNVTGVLAKYPRPVDSAQNLYEYDMEKASEAGALSVRYSQLAEPGIPTM